MSTTSFRILGIIYWQTARQCMTLLLHTQKRKGLFHHLSRFLSPATASRRSRTKDPIHPSVAKVETNELVVMFVMPTRSKKCISRVHAASITHGECIPQVRCVGMGIGQDWSQSDTRQVGQQELHWMGVHGSQGTGSCNTMMELVNSLVKVGEMKHSMRPIEPDGYYPKRDAQFRQLSRSMPLVLFRQAMVTVQCVKQSLFSLGNEGPNHQHVEGRDADNVPASLSVFQISQGRFALDLLSVQPFPKRRVSRISIQEQTHSAPCPEDDISHESTRLRIRQRLRYDVESHGCLDGYNVFFVAFRSSRFNALSCDVMRATERRHEWGRLDAFGCGAV